MNNFLKALTITILIVVTIRSFIVESNYVSSGSMTPTLIVGDRIFTTKFSFGFMIPFSDKKIISYSTPKRGEIIVFLAPSKKETLKNGFEQFLKKEEKFIKRVVAIAGDTILMKNQVLYLNGKEIKKISSNFEELNYKGDENSFNSLLYKEKIGEHSFYTINHLIKIKHTANFGVDKKNKISYNEDDIISPYRVPKGYFFVIGDNRDDSFDSRFFGPIPIKNLQGRTLFRWFSIYNDDILWRRIGGI